MKKVLAIAPYPYLPYSSGGQKFIAKFFEYLSREVELTVISVAANEAEPANTYKILPLLKKPFSRYYDGSLVRKISLLIEKEKFDTVIWEHPYYSWLAKRIKKRTGIKTIIHTHNIEYQRFRSMGKWWWPILKIYEKRCLKRADTVFFITQEDKNFAILQWKMEKEKCIVVPFGVDINKYPQDKAECKNLVCQKHRVDKEVKILLFNGLLNYKPNLDALKTILDKINPLLLNQPSFRYKIIICGKGLPEELNSLKNYADKNIVYAGFVDEIETYFKGADIFLNPVQSGGGIKTKMVEAIGFGTTVIATESGASGIKKEVCGEKLVIVPDNDWDDFTDAVINNARNVSTTPQQYYKFYSWEGIIQRAATGI